MFEKSFKNEELGFELTSYIDKQQNVWFLGKDVAEILGYSKTRDALSRHVDSEDKKLICCRPQNVDANNSDLRGKHYTFINESGFYSLVLSSKLETAKKFKKWVTSEVLPSIRKYGYFKLFKLENETMKKQRVIIDGKKYYNHPVFSNYAASKSGDIISLRTKKIMSMVKCGGYLYFVIYDKKLEKPKNYYQHRFVYEIFKGPIPSCFEVDHINNFKHDNRIKNLQLLTPQKNLEKSKNKPIISINIENGKERRFISIKTASIELGISAGNISNICRKRKSCKTASSKKDGKKYLFRYLD